MKRPAIGCLVAASCMLAAEPARADSCDSRFGGSCRAESTTTIVRVKGEAAVASTRRSRVKQSRTERSQRRAKRQLARSAAPVRAESIAEPPAPATAARSAANPTRIVDEGFNTLAAEDYLDPLLEQALMKVRQQILGAALP